MMKFTILPVLLLAYSCGTGQAQQTIIYGPDGRRAGTVTTDSQGSRTIYDSQGRVSGRTSTDSQGTTVIYGPNGSRIGTTTSGGKR